MEVLGREGGARFSVRSTEGEAGLPHGSVRHHFGGLDRLVDAMVEHLLRAEMEHAITSPRRRSTTGSVRTAPAPRPATS